MFYLAARWHGKRDADDCIVASTLRFVFEVRQWALVRKGWFGLAGSRGVSLDKPVTCDETGIGRAFETQSRFEGDKYRTLRLWNGEDEFDSCSLSITAGIDAGSTNGVVLRGPVAPAGAPLPVAAAIGRLRFLLTTFSAPSGIYGSRQLNDCFAEHGEDTAAEPEAAVVYLVCRGENPGWGDGTEPTAVRAGFAAFSAVQRLRRNFSDSELAASRKLVGQLRAGTMGARTR